MNNKTKALLNNNDASGIVRRILDIDEQSRSITEKAYKDRAEAEKKLVTQKKELQEKYLNRAKHRVDVMRLDIKTDNEKRLAELSKNSEVVLEQLNNVANENNDKWVDEIFKRVLNG